MFGINPIYYNNLTLIVKGPISQKYIVTNLKLVTVKIFAMFLNFLYYAQVYW